MPERPEFIRDMFGKKIGRLDVLKGKYFYGAAETSSFDAKHRRPIPCHFCKKIFTPNVGHNRFCNKNCKVIHAKLLYVRKKVKWVQHLSYDITVFQQYDNSQCLYDEPQRNSFL